MGSMLCRAWEKAGHKVLAYDPHAEGKLAGSKVTELGPACAEAEAVILCVPIVAMDTVLGGLVPHLDGKQVLADIASVKVAPLRQMQAAYQGPVVGTHPLFGHEPQADELSVCVCPGEKAEERHAGLIEQLFADMGCTSFRRSAWEHDKALAAIQGLNFITNVAYFAALAHHEEYLPFLTPSFRRRRKASETMLTRDAELFEAIFEANPLSQEMVRHFSSFLQVAAGGDINVLVERAKWWFGEGMSSK